MPFEIEIQHAQHHERRALGMLDSISIGRDAECTISLNSSLVSRRHVTLSIAGSLMRVQDSSRNGTLGRSCFGHSLAPRLPAC